MAVANWARSNYWGKLGFSPGDTRGIKAKHMIQGMCYNASNQRGATVYYPAKHGGSLALRYISFSNPSFDIVGNCRSLTLC